MNILKLLQEKLRAALGAVVADPTSYAEMLKPAQDPRHGDYQANCAMKLAKELGRSPRDVAQTIVDHFPLDQMLEPPQIAGAGFINLRLRLDWMADQVQHVAADERLGVAPAEPARTFVIDYSSPNVAKPMHVGHLRSTIIGDALARLHRFLGHRVITDNHLGDWGTQFGILLHGYKHFRDETALATDPVREMARLYIKVRSLMKADDEEEAEAVPDPIADAARQETAKLHAGDAENLALWQKFMPWCLEEINKIYRRLDVHFGHTLGESFYNPMLAGVVETLLARRIAQRSEGAVVVFLDPNGPPALVQKRDGAFTYTTTDLATIRYRAEHWRPDAILYVVDFRQRSHFEPMFQIARRMGFDQMHLEHVSFGAMLGADRKPLQTRKGTNTELSALLDEGVERALRQYESNRSERLARGDDVPELSEAERRKIAEVVGIGAIKYADLSQNRTTDYVFNWDKMLAMDGNTATYMQYAYVRNQGILRKGGIEPEAFRMRPPRVSLDQPDERALALQILRLGDVLDAAAAEYKPNLITSYLWDLAKSYSGFFNNCPVLKASTPELRQSRLLLSDLTARIIRQCLDLLGIRTIERM
jgi:arginyl-tRNA synthetase